jgi:hypothetical protein
MFLIIETVPSRSKPASEVRIYMMLVFVECSLFSKWLHFLNFHLSKLYLRIVPIKVKPIVGAIANVPNWQLFCGYWAMEPKSERY